MASGFIPFSRKDKVPVDKIQETQNRLIRAIAEKGNCVIVGRGADYNLSIDTGVFTKTQAMEIILNAMEKYKRGKKTCLKQEENPYFFFSDHCMDDGLCHDAI